MTRSIAVASVAALSACATADPSRRSPELVVEGNLASDPMFEEAAKMCGYTAYWLFPGVKASRVEPHFNLFNVNSPPARCALQWLDEHPAAGLHASFH